MGWPDGWTIVANWNGKGNPPVEPRYPPDGLAGRLDDRDGVAKSLLAKGNSSHAEDLDTYFTGSFAAAESDLLPLGLDSHRYRCCGNGVVTAVPEWFGARLAAVLA